MSIPQRSWLCDGESRLHRRVVGEPQGAAVERQLAALGGPPGRRLEGLQAAGGGGGDAEVLAQADEDRRVLGRPQVEVAAEDQRRPAGELGGGAGAAEDVLGGEGGTVVGRVQGGD